MRSGLYDTLQFPLLLSVHRKGHCPGKKLCQELNVGFIAMKGLSGGLITNSATQPIPGRINLKNALPIWGVQREELDFISYIENPPVMDGGNQGLIGQRTEKTNFCRACGYCMPCPAASYGRPHVSIDPPEPVDQLADGRKPEDDAWASGNAMGWIRRAASAESGGLQTDLDGTVQV